MTIKSLIDFIDRYTSNGAVDPSEPWGEDIGIKLEECIALIRSFSSRNWLSLRALNLKQKSNFWVRFLIKLLDISNTEEARQMIIYIALNSAEDNFYDAMECIQNFRRDVSTYEWLKLKNRAAEMRKSRKGR